MTDDTLATSYLKINIIISFLLEEITVTMRRVDVRRLKQNGNSYSCLCCLGL